MPTKPWGKKTEPLERLPTLEKWLEDNPGDYPDPFQIVRVNKSQNYGCFILRCVYQDKEAFVVQLFENNPKYEQFMDGFTELRDSNSALYIQIVDSEWAHWDFVTSDEHICTWSRSNNGWAATIAKKFE